MVRSRSPRGCARSRSPSRLGERRSSAAAERSRAERVRSERVGAKGVRTEGVRAEGAARGSGTGGRGSRAGGLRAVVGRPAERRRAEATGGRARGGSARRERRGPHRGTLRPLLALLTLLDATGRWRRGTRGALARDVADGRRQARRTRRRREVGRQAGGSSRGRARNLRRGETNGHSGRSATDGCQGTRLSGRFLRTLDGPGKRRAKQAQDEGSSVRLHCDRIGNGSLTKDASIKLDNQKASIVKKNQTAVVTKSPGLGVKKKK